MSFLFKYSFNYFIYLTIYLGIISCVSAMDSAPLDSPAQRSTVNYPTPSQLADEYWEDFQTSYREGKTSTLVEYVQSLYILPTGISEEELTRRSCALLYFLTTGGKYGFRKTPATSAETVVLENAFLFLGLAEAADTTSFPGLDLTRIRRRYGFQEEDENIQQHLILGQRYFTYGRIIGLWHQQHAPQLIRIILSQDYVLPRLVQEFKRGRSIDSLQAELKSLKDDFSSNLALRSSMLWEGLLKVEAGNRYNAKESLKKGDVTDLAPILSGFDNIIRESLAYSIPMQSVSPTSSPYEEHRPSSLRRTARPMVVLLKNGSVIIRKADGSFFSQGTIQHFGEWNGLFNGDTYDPGEDDCVRSDQSEEELLAFLSGKSLIIEKFYAGEAKDYAGLTSRSVWPEAFPVQGYRVFPQVSEQPNADLIQRLKVECDQKYEKMLGDLNLPQYQSSFINHATLTEMLRSRFAQLKQILEQGAQTGGFTEKHNDLDDQFERVISQVRMENFYSLDFQDTQSSSDEANASHILKMAYKMLREEVTCFRQINYLLKSITSNHIFYSQRPREYCEESDVLAIDLPSKEIVEEGEAEIIRSDDTLEIKVKSDGTIISFEDFWLGSDARILVHMPFDQARVTFYHRSGRTSFMKGKIEFKTGLVDLCIPCCYHFSALSSGRINIVGNKLYYPKSARRYPIDLRDWEKNVLA